VRLASQSNDYLPLPAVEGSTQSELFFRLLLKNTVSWPPTAAYAYFWPAFPQITMPKHVHSEHYVGSPYDLIPKVTIHPEIEHHDHAPDTEHYLLPAVFTYEKGEILTIRYPGPGVFYVTEGEIQFEDTANPGNPTVLSTGSVLHIEEGSVFRWSSPSVAKGFAAFYVPVSIKGFDDFVVSE
jgi:hypothetical protein